MRCPICRALNTRVVDSRLAEEGDQVRRRRQCSRCGARFTTYETAELDLPRIIKQSGRREPFDEEKLRRGFMRALEKRNVPTEQVEAAINRIKLALMASGEREIESRRIGDRVMHELRRLDTVAYIRYASIYLSFEDTQSFRELLDRLEHEPDPEAMNRQLPLLEGGGEQADREKS